jgi:hypothetical protein
MIYQNLHMTNLNKIKMMFSCCFCIAATACAFPVDSVGAAGCANRVRAFLSEPNYLTLHTLSNGNDYVCWGVIGSSNSNLLRLNSSIASGNKWAAQYLLSYLNELDGGVLEDALVSLGQFADSDPEEFLSFSLHGEMSEYQMRNAVTMLPLSLSDSPEAQLAFLSVRRTRLIKVSGKNLQIQKNIALSAIDEFELEIKRATNP